MRLRVSAGLLLFRTRNGLEVFIAHPGGPLFPNKDDGHWTIPKGEAEPGEDLLATAIREFEEEVGFAVDRSSKFIPLEMIQQKGGKIVHAWAVEGDIDEAHPLRSNTFTMEWPPGSGTMCDFPEVDRAQFFPVAVAQLKLKPTQLPLLERLEQAIRNS
jgi:predicted NUDIX family NTP pyrophosphohydrolase